MSLPAILERAWIRAVAPALVRPLRVPDCVFVVCVGGATLGGSGKTPLAIACARALSDAPHAGVIAFLGHAYRALPGRARVVERDDGVRIVGDEALVAARSLQGTGVRVLVAPSRQEALDLALLRGASCVVIDGPLQLQPRRADLAWLAVDSYRPWGIGACPPRGDLRAPVQTLRATCDRVVSAAGTVRLPHTKDVLATMRLGLVTSLARPARIIDALARDDVYPVACVHARDHHAPSPRALRASARRHRIDAWLTTEKCATHLERAVARDGGVEAIGAPLLVMGHDVVLEPAARDELYAALDRARTRDGVRGFTPLTHRPR